MDIFKKIIELNNENRAFVLSTIIESSGSVPGKTGFKMIVDTNGDSYGTVGGGAIEKEVIKESLSKLSKGANGVHEYLLSDKTAGSEKGNYKVIPMNCNGRVKIFFEVFNQKPAVYIFGSGHVGSALLKILSMLPYHLVLIDNRQEFTPKEIITLADEFYLEEYEKYSSEFEPAAGAYIVIVTHGHLFDFNIMEKVIARGLDVNYIGVIASKDKARDMMNKLKENLGVDTDISKIRSPIGLKIGGSTAEEIALSISAEIQSIRYHKIIEQLPK